MTCVPPLHERTLGGGGGGGGQSCRESGHAQNGWAGIGLTVFSGRVSRLHFKSGRVGAAKGPCRAWSPVIIHSCPCMRYIAHKIAVRSWACACAFAVVAIAVCGHNRESIRRFFKPLLHCGDQRPRRRVSVPRPSVVFIQANIYWCRFYVLV